MYRLKGTAGAVINQSFPISGNLVVGTAPGCDVRIDDDGFAELSVVIGLADDGQIEFTSSGNGSSLAVNGAVMAAGNLQPGDELRVGRCAFLLQAPGLRPERRLGEAPARSRPWARVWLAVALAAAVLALLALRGGWLA